MINKEFFIFFTIIGLGIFLGFGVSISMIVLIFVSLVFIYLFLNRKNRMIGLPSLVATLTVLFVLYLFGLLGDCHLCTTKKDGVIFFCNRLINMAPLNYEKQLGDNTCTKELIWVYP
ncbi:MAG: hypothetical protein CMD88_05000 [Gammaproteobacteria bacterium]|nr:hypothetical protein [Gammaproteobacteria bacterium]|tara:strand:+ start:14977 stop:15327 length:351 start_codon:yes stop_codon:yes gene_type:complete